MNGHSRTVRQWCCGLLPAGVLLCATTVGAQERDGVDRAMIARIRAEGMERSRVQEVFDTLTVAIGPRLTGSPAFNRATAFTRDWLTRIGLANARLEPFAFGRGWSLESQTLELVAPRYASLIGYAEAWTPATRGVVQGRPIYVGKSTAAEIAAMRDRLRGAIVLAQQPQTVFTRADRLQPTEADGPVRTGAPQRAPHRRPLVLHGR